MDKALEFINSQKLMTIASYDSGDVWIASVYAGVDTKGTIYFISSEDAKHSKMILKNPKIAFSFAWFDPKNYTNRKGVQGTGICRLAKDSKEIVKGLTLINSKFPVFQKIFTLQWILNNIWKSKVWAISPAYIKYWDDEIYGDKESKEFVFDVCGH